VNLKKVNNTDLAKLCAQEPDNKKAWLEFYQRFDKWIWLVVYRECKAKGIINHDSQIHQTVQDLVQDVYVKLVSNNCKALANFIGASEKSIYTYLDIIAKSIVRNYITKIKARKRPSIEKSLDEVFSISEKGEKILDKDIFRPTYLDVDEEFKIQIFKEEIEDILDIVLKGKHKDRDKLIFKLYLYDGFTAEDIASQSCFMISSKRISNLITHIKKKLRRELLERRMAVY